MDLIPAIDIRAGNCVRLYKGDYLKETIFSDNPFDVAVRWQKEGATRIHIVDLDGAKSGQRINYEVIDHIANNSDVKIQVGGGIRSLDSAKKYFRLGVDRLILGTAAVDDPILVQDILKYWGPDSLIISIDARDGIVSLDGWTRSTDIKVLDLLETMGNLGVKRCMYTDINRDGTLTEPNYEVISDLVGSSGINIIAAGGISTFEALQTLNDIGVESAIVGRSIYTGDLDFKEAINKLTYMNRNS